MSKTIQIMPPTFQLVALLFLMLGPFKIIGPFAKMTANADPKLTNKIALRAILFAVIGVLLASLLGENILKNFTIPIPILSMTGGLILFLVALSNVIQTYTPTTTNEEITLPTIQSALNPLAFPLIVTPYGLAAVIVFMTISPTVHDKLIIGVIVISIMILNLIVMMLTRYIGKILFLFLSIIGSVLGVVQVALGLMIVIHQVQIIFGLQGGI